MQRCLQRGSEPISNTMTNVKKRILANAPIVAYRKNKSLQDFIGRFQPISRDTHNNRETYDFWWTNKRR